MSKNTTLIPFQYESKEVRTVTDESGNPWFVAKDVCAIIGINNVAMALSKIPSNHKGVNPIDTLGGIQKLSVVDEPGLYRLILRSDKPKAEPFMEWVTSEVLPQIRKTGCYQNPAVPLKFCVHCKKEKPISEFHVSSHHRDGCQSWCKECRYNYNKKPEQKKIEFQTPVNESDLACRISKEVIATFWEAFKFLPKTSEKEISDRITAEVLKVIPSNSGRFGVREWSKTWDDLCGVHVDLSNEVDSLLKEMGRINGGWKHIPKGKEVLPYIEKHYSDLERIARKVCVLSELMLFRSPKITGGVFHPGNPNY